MTVSSSTSTATFLPNNATVFPLPFRFFDNDDIQVFRIDATSGLATPQALGVDYTLAGAGEPEQDGSAVSVLTLTSPLALGGPKLYVERVMPIDQPTDIVNQGRFFPEVHEDVFDRLTMLIQQLAAVIGVDVETARALVLGAGDVDGSGSYRAKNNKIANLGSASGIFSNAANYGDVVAYVASLLAALTGNSNVAGNVIYAAPGGLFRSVQDRLADVVSIRDFAPQGQAADGVTDWQAAFDAAAASTHTAIYLPPGKYLLGTGNINIAGKCFWSNTGKNAAAPYGDIGAVIHTTQTANPVFILGKGSIIDGLHFFYPNQDGSTITDVSGYPTIVGAPIVYPPTLKTVTNGCSGFAVMNTVFINSYHCMEFGDPAFVGACGRAIIQNVDAFALKHFMTVYNALGEIFVSNVDVSSIVYQDVANIGDMKLYKWRQQNADDFVLKKADGFTVSSSIFLGANRNIHVPTGQTLGLTKWENVIFDQARTVLDAESPCSNMLFDGCQIFGKTLFANEPAADLFRLRSSTSAVGLGPITVSDTQIISALRSPFSLETANCVTRLELNNVSITAWAQATGLAGEIAAVYAAPAATGTAIIVNGGSMRSVGYATSVGISHNATTGSQVYANGTIFNGCFKSVKAVNTTQQEVINCSSGNTGSVDLDLTGATTFREKGNRWNKPPVTKQDGSPWFVGRTAVAQATSGGTALTVIFGTKLKDADVSLNSATGVFTAKVAGAYQFSARLSHAGGTAGDVFALSLITTLGNYENRFTALSTAQSEDIDATIEMRVGDTAEIRLQRVSGAGVITLNGNAGGNYFTGRLID